MKYKIEALKDVMFSTEAALHLFFVGFLGYSILAIYCLITRPEFMRAEVVFDEQLNTVPAGISWHLVVMLVIAAIICFKMIIVTASWLKTDYKRYLDNENEGRE